MVFKLSLYEGATNKGKHFLKNVNRAKSVEAKWNVTL